MSARLKKLLEDRANAWSQVQDIRSRCERENRDPSETEDESYERGLADVERLSKEIEREERADRAGREVDALDPDDARSTNPVLDAGDDTPDVSEQYREAFEGYLRRGIDGVRPEHREMFQDAFVTEDRAQGVSSDTAGGYTVPKEFLNRMIEALKDFGGILSVAEVMNTTTGRDLSWPTNDETNNKGQILPENTQVTELDTVFGTFSLKAHMYTSRMVRISYQLLQDSAFNMNVWLPRKLGERIGRAAAEHFAIGTGTNQPQGLTVGLASGATVAAGLTYAGLVDLEHSIDPAYRTNGRQRYVAHDTFVAAARKLTDGDDRPLWVPSMVGGIPSTINGHPYTVDNSMPALAAGATPAVFGDIKEAYLVRVVNGAQTLRLTERYADFLQVGFLGFQRLDGKVQNDAAARKLTIAS